MSSTVSRSRRILCGAAAVIAATAFTACSAEESPAPQVPTTGAVSTVDDAGTVPAGSVDATDEVDAAVDEELESLDADLEELEAAEAELSGTVAP